MECHAVTNFNHEPSGLLSFVQGEGTRCVVTVEQGPAPRAIFHRVGRWMGVLLAADVEPGEQVTLRVARRHDERPVVPLELRFVGRSLTLPIRYPLSLIHI